MTLIDMLPWVLTAGSIFLLGLLVYELIHQLRLNWGVGAKNQIDYGKWADDLESGRYEQGEGALYNRYGRYCCLGVLAETQMNLGDWKAGGEVPLEESDKIYEAIQGAGVDLALFIQMNDREHRNFKEIALQIRRMRQ